MDKKTQNKVRIIEKTFESIKKDNKGLANTSLLRVAEELSMPYRLTVLSYSRRYLF